MNRGVEQHAQGNSMQVVRGVIMKYGCILQLWERQSKQVTSVDEEIWSLLTPSMSDEEDGEGGEIKEGDLAGAQRG